MPSKRYRSDRRKWEVFWLELGRRRRQLVQTEGEANDLIRALRRKISLLKAGLEDEIAKAKGGRITLEDWGQAYLDGPGQMKRSASDDRSRFKNHLSKFFGGTLLSAITEASIETYRQRRTKADAKPATVNRELALLRHLLRRAQRQGLLGRVPQIQMAAEIRPETRRALTLAEVKRLLAACDEELQPLVVLALATGLRKGELLSLTWANIDLTPEKEAVLVDNRADGSFQTKTSHARQVPLSAEAIAILKPLRGLPGAPVFRGRNGHLTDFYTRWRTVLKKAELVGIPFHALRHTFITRAAEVAGSDPFTVMRLAGHRTIQTTLRYFHGNADRERSIINGAQIVPPGSTTVFPPATGDTVNS